MSSYIGVACDCLLRMCLGLCSIYIEEELEDGLSYEEFTCEISLYDENVMQSNRP